MTPKLHSQAQLRLVGGQTFSAAGAGNFRKSTGFLFATFAGVLGDLRG
jgi:hypothetical protein